MENQGNCAWCGGMTDDPFSDDVCDDCQEIKRERQEEIDLENALNGDVEED